MFKKLKCVSHGLDLNYRRTNTEEQKVILALIITVEDS